jgi:hypothetical protein
MCTPLTLLAVTPRQRISVKTHKFTKFAKAQTQQAMRVNLLWVACCCLLFFILYPLIVKPAFYLLQYEAKSHSHGKQVVASSQAPIRHEEHEHHHHNENEINPSELSFSSNILDSSFMPSSYAERWKLVEDLLEYLVHVQPRDAIPLQKRRIRQYLDLKNPAFGNYTFITEPSPWMARVPCTMLGESEDTDEALSWTMEHASEFHLNRSVAKERFACLPSFFLNGFPKCGSTALHTILTQHPNLTRT